MAKFITLDANTDAPATVNAELVTHVLKSHDNKTKLVFDKDNNLFVDESYEDVISKLNG